jgi:hypothetical protein
VREPLPAGERARAAFVPHAATAAGAFTPPHIADTAVLYGARPHGHQPIPLYTLGAIGEATGKCSTRSLNKALFKVAASVCLGQAL